jgi:hypothetical protein
MMNAMLHREPGTPSPEPEVPVIDDPAEPDGPRIPEMPPPVPNPPDVVACAAARRAN